MKLRIAVQMDPPEQLVLAGDTTFAMALEATSRGHQLFAYTPDSLALDESWFPVAWVQKLNAEAKPERFYRSQPATCESLAAFDVVLVRQDPPYDLRYLTATWFLDFARDKTLIVNDPTTLRDAPEKLWMGALRESIPRTMTSDDLEQVRAFAQTCPHGVVLKPLYGNGGRGVVRTSATDENLASLLESWADAWQAPPQVQEFLPAVMQGDKRVLLIAGAVVGALNRVPAAGDFRANLRVGATSTPCGLTDGEQEISQRVADALWRRGVFVAGLDFIDGRLTEVNITSPTGFRGLETAATGKVSCSALFWDAVEQAVEVRQQR